MDIKLQPGRYVLAVSGGVDSMVLFDVLRRRADIKLTVAHFDHGIRADSPEDRRLVQAMAERYGLPFVYSEGNLPSGASEAEAREARYAFLRQVRLASGAKAILTAHHQDDLLETVIMNILRGTGRKGLAPLLGSSDVHRPLLHLPKHALHTHARDNQLVWREDSTNSNQKYKRNYVRQAILPRLSAEAQARLLEIAHRQSEVNKQIDTIITNELHLQDSRDALRRSWFTGLSHNVAKEVLASWLRSHNLGDFDRRMLDRLVVGAKVSPPGKAMDIVRNHQLHINADYLLLKKS